jgi:hypothetical protein
VNLFTHFRSVAVGYRWRKRSIIQDSATFSYLFYHTTINSVTTIIHHEFFRQCSSPVETYHLPTNGLFASSVTSGSTLADDDTQTPPEAPWVGRRWRTHLGHDNLLP